jgi:hypothetical protein
MIRIADLAEIPHESKYIYVLFQFCFYIIYDFTPDKHAFAYMLHKNGTYTQEGDFSPDDYVQQLNRETVLAYRKEALENFEAKNS